MKNIVISTIILFSILLIFCSCNLRNRNNPQFEINIENQRKETANRLTEAKDKGYISENEYNLILEQLTADCDKFLLSENALTCAQIDSMVVKSLGKFENIRINEEVISIITLHYSILSSSNQVRTIFPVGEYCNPGAIIWPWFELRQTTEDKFNDARNRVKRFQETSFDKISSEKVDSVAQRAYQDIDKIEVDSTLTEEQIRALIKASLDASIASEMEMGYTHQVGNIYFRLAKIKDVDESDIDAYFLSPENNPEMKPKSDEELKPYVEERLNWMLEEGLVSRTEYSLLKKHMMEDLDAFLKGSENEEQLLKRASNSLDKLKKVELDTEDREFVAEIYYDMAKRRGVNIADMVNLWLYGKELMEATHNIKKEK